MSSCMLLYMHRLQPKNVILPSAMDRRYHVWSLYLIVIFVKPIGTESEIELSF